MTWTEVEKERCGKLSLTATYTDVLHVHSQTRKPPVASFERQWMTKECEGEAKPVVIQHEG